MFCIHCGVSLPDGAQFCRQCGSTLAVAPKTDSTELASRTGATSSQTWKTSPKQANGGVTEVARGVGYWMGRHPIWTILLAVFILGLLGRSVVNEGQERIKPRIQSTASNVEGEGEHRTSPQTGMNNDRQASSFTADERQHVAKLLEANFKQQDLDVGVVAGGDQNDTLIMYSDMFKNTQSRATVMGMVRTYWQDQLCKSGFKTVVFTGEGFFSGSHEYALRCPKTPDERAALAASLQDDYRKEGVATTVQAAGPNKEVFSLVTSMDAFQSAADRAAFFQQMKSRGLLEELCSQGFKQVSIQYTSPGSKPSLFSLKCSSF